MGKADRLINKISECQRELTKLQNECNHSKKEIKFVNYKDGVRFVCKDCKALLGWPGKHELDRWANK
jgi:phage host-nuclease inhibitor protein Gam